MAKSKNKTVENDLSVKDFILKVEDEQKRKDCQTLVKLFGKITGSKPKMWGTSIVGFGQYHYKYESGREGDSPLAGFSPRKQNLTIYCMAGFDRYDDIMGRLGKFKTGKSCLYVKKLEDVDMDVLTELVTESVAHTAKAHQGN